MSESLSQLAGPLLSGYLLNWGLYGVLSVQVYVYWTAFPNDSRSAQALVYGIYLLDTAQTFSLTYDAFQNFVVGFTDPAALDKIHNLWLDTYLIDGIVAFLVQLYYARRIHRLLPNSKIIPGIIVFMAIAQFAGMIDVCIDIKKIELFSLQQRLIDLDGIVTSVLWIGCSAIADVLIATTMVYSLSRFDTTFRETRSLIRRLNKLMMETCSLVAITSLLQPCLFWFFPRRSYHITPAIVIAKLYSNSLLVVLNSRARVHGRRGSLNGQVTEGTDWRTSVRVVTNRDTEIPLSTRS